MLDPAATQFRDLKRCSGDKDVWLGEFNGKNAYGAYTGFKPFFYKEYRAVMAGDDAFMSLMDRCYSDVIDKVVPSATEHSVGDVEAAANKAADAAERAAAAARVALDEAQKSMETSGE